MRLNGRILAALLLAGCSVVSGCKHAHWNRAVVWTDPPEVSGNKVVGDFMFAFSIAESCQGLSLQAQGIPKTPRWVLKVAAVDSVEGDSYNGPVRWSLAHAEEPEVAFQRTSANLDQSVKDVCALVKEQGRS